MNPARRVTAAPFFYSPVSPKESWLGKAHPNFHRCVPTVGWRASTSSCSAAYVQEVKSFGRTQPPEPSQRFEHCADGIAHFKPASAAHFKGASQASNIPTDRLGTLQPCFYCTLQPCLGGLDRQPPSGTTQPNPEASLISLPPSSAVDVGAFSGLFSNTTNSYKYLFFLSLLHALEKTYRLELPATQQVKRLLVG